MDKLSLRELQKECARASAVLPYKEIAYLSSKTNYSSVDYYKLVINKYIEKYGDLPSKIGPGQKINLLYEEDGRNHDNE